jgi:hypothetical protein
VTVRVTGVEHDTIVAFLSSGCTTCQKFWDAFRKPRQAHPARPHPAGGGHQGAPRGEPVGGGQAGATRLHHRDHRRRPSSSTTCPVRRTSSTCTARAAGCAARAPDPTGSRWPRCSNRRRATPTWLPTWPAPTWPSRPPTRPARPASTGSCTMPESCPATTSLYGPDATTTAPSGTVDPDGAAMTGRMKLQAHGIDHRPARRVGRPHHPALGPVTQGRDGRRLRARCHHRAGGQPRRDPQPGGPPRQLPAARAAGRLRLRSGRPHDRGPRARGALRVRPRERGQGAVPAAGRAHQPAAQHVLVVGAAAHAPRPGRVPGLLHRSGNRAFCLLHGARPPAAAARVLPGANATLVGHEDLAPDDGHRQPPHLHRHHDRRRCRSRCWCRWRCPCRERRRRSPPGAGRLRARPGARHHRGPGHARRTRPQPAPGGPHRRQPHPAHVEPPLVPHPHRNRGLRARHRTGAVPAQAGHGLRQRVRVRAPAPARGGPRSAAR